MSEKIVLSEKWVRKIYRKEGEKDCNLTFCGALEKCYFFVSKRWNKDTKIKNNASYEKIILPALENHDDKLISEYTKEDFENAIETIRTQGFNDRGVIRIYSESSLKNFERLIYYVVFQAAQQGYCENVLWGTRFQIEVIDIEQNLQMKFQIKKSLTPEQEKKLVDELLEDVEMPGEQVAVLLMLGLGTRNGEACALDYGDIKKLQEFPEDVVAWIYKSVIPGTNEVQSSGKTKNAGRIVPIPQRIALYLEKRKQLLKEHLKEIGVLDDVDINQLPIVCCGNMYEGDNYNLRAPSRNVTNMAKKLFREIGLEGIQIAYLEAELLEDGYGEIVNEKDPTAYLLRRNYATHLQILGLSIPEMQYLIGHNVEDVYESRNEFVDEKRIHEMAKKLAQRPLLNDIIENQDEVEIVLKKAEEARIIIEAQEPMDELKITITADNPTVVRGKYYMDSYERKFGRTIDVKKSYRKGYS